MNRNTVVILAALAIWAAALNASVIDWQSYQGPMVGARALSLSGCVAGIDNDPSVIYWNPAQLSALRWPMFIVNYTHSSGLLSDPLFSGPKRINYLALAAKGMGLSWRSIVRHAEETVALQGADSVSNYLRYGVDEFAVVFGQNDEYNPNTAMGLTAKILWGRMLEITQTQSGALWTKARTIDENSVGYGIDIGFYGNYEKLKFGVSGQNIVGKVYWKKVEDDKLKPKLWLGGAIVADKLPKISGAIEKYLGSGTPPFRYSLAGEYKYALPGYGAVSGRLGYSRIYKAAKEDYVWTGGVGYLYKKFLIDGAVVNTLDLATNRWQQSFVGAVSLYLE
ncbi:hypothetical protein HY768_02325 [candidate division TA06 bacterium]|uniref:PorV/PorQ family protein n=1 Tax=candidate division TA06 bacterium TaxID=2250710 RepID=A0A933I7R2_UNCT6|nr:hypothetical protein [candidate division TA06 bacterium]